MKRVQITADKMLDIVKGVFAAPEIDSLTDGNTIQEELNVAYYTFKYRPASTEQIIAELKESGEDIDLMQGLKRSFCCFVLGAYERSFSPDIDQVGIEGVMDFWVQTSKIQLLEQLIDRCNKALTGARFEVNFLPENLTRQASLIFDAPDIPDFDLESQIGESVRISVGWTIILNPSGTATYADYVAEFGYVDGGEDKTATLPLLQFSYRNDISGRGVPYADNPSNVGSLNLSASKTMHLSFEGIESDFVDWLCRQSLSGDGMADINTPIAVTITRKGETYAPHNMVLQQHAIEVIADISNETHSLVLVPRGIR